MAPWDEVMGKFHKGTLRSGGKGKGHPKVTDPDQAVAIMYSEKRKAGSKPEYRSKKKKKKRPKLSAADQAAALKGGKL